MGQLTNAHICAVQLIIWAGARLVNCAWTKDSERGMTPHGTVSLHA